MDRRVSACLIWRSRRPCFSRLIPVTADIECACKLGKRAGRGAAWSMRREADEEAKGQIDYMLLAGLSSPSLAPVLRSVSSAHDVFKRGQDFADLNPVKINWPENARTPERAPGERVPSKPLNPLDQFFCALLDFSKQLVMVGGEGSFFGGRIIVPRARDGLLSQPPPPCPMRGRQRVSADPVCFFPSRLTLERIVNNRRQIPPIAILDSRFSLLGRIASLLRSREGCQPNN